jgi:hypothetical protein
MVRSRALDADPAHRLHDPLDLAAAQDLDRTLSVQTVIGIEIDLLVVPSDVGLAIVGQVGGGFTFDLETYVDARLIAADAGERDRREGGSGLRARR